MLKAILLDLDGTIYRGTELVTGAAIFIARARKAGIKCLFLTNNATKTAAQVASKLEDFGIACIPSDVVTASQVAAAYIGSGKVFCVGEDGLKETLSEAGLTVTEDKPDFVVVGLDRTLTYQKLAHATTFILGGAKFIATNRDKVLITEVGIAPGGGAIVEAVITATGKIPVVVGKPEPMIVLEALRRLVVQPAEALLVGDNVETDIPAGNRAGVRTVLLLTGVSTADDCVKLDEKPTWILKGFNELADLVENETL